jgi:hypothetical protein
MIDKIAMATAPTDMRGLRDRALLLHRSKDRIYSIASSAANSHRSDLLFLADTDAESRRYFARW